MKQKLKMLIKIADLQMSLWNMRGWNAEPGYQATCVAKRNKWHDVKCRALSLMATKAEQEAGTTPFQTLKGRIRSMVAMNRQEIEQRIIHFLYTNYTPQEYADFVKEMQDIGAGALFTQLEWSFSQDCLRRQQMC